ncbi:hypothetical protein BMETH_131415442421290, partial [methanotrophic bacterial endosymbiont of Bathymodiolus sp.]
YFAIAGVINNNVAVISALGQRVFGTIFN